MSSEFSSGSTSWILVVVCISNKQQTNALYRILPSLFWFLHRQEEQKISKCYWHFCSSHHVRYFQRNDWSKLAVNSISLDSHESKVTCVFLQSYFTGIICISRDHLSWFSQPHGACVCLYICVCCDMINVVIAAACPLSSVLLVASLSLSLSLSRSLSLFQSLFFCLEHSLLHLFFHFHSHMKENHKWHLYNISSDVPGQ